jgi:hypothetical protein
VDTFDNGVQAAAQNGIAWKSLGNNVSISTDRPYSGSHSLKFSYRGKSDPCTDASVEQRFWLPQLTEVWIEYMFFVPTNFNHRKPAGCKSNAANQKFFRIWGPDEKGYANGNPKAGASLDPIKDSSGNYSGESKLYMQWEDEGGLKHNVAMAGQEPGSTWWPAFTFDGRNNSAKVGTWIKVQMHYKLSSSPTASNGMIELWINGVMRVSLTARDWYGSAGNYLAAGYLLGWANVSYDEDTDFFIDDFRVLTSNPGW